MKWHGNPTKQQLKMPKDLRKITLDKTIESLLTYKVVLIKDKKQRKKKSIGLNVHEEAIESSNDTEEATLLPKKFKKVFKNLLSDKSLNSYKFSHF